MSADLCRLTDAANEALDKYSEYMELEADDPFDSEEARWAFIDAAVEILETITGRNVGDELVY